jgi:glycosyltransferase involved in cell wall biosynthesis
MLRSAVSVVIPAYNEEETVGQVVDETISVMDSLGVPYEVIIVDDGSTDRTGRVASKCKATVLINGTNRGKGYSMRKGFEQAHGDIIVTLDADGAHSPKEIPDMIVPLYNGTDIVAGSRFLGNGTYSTSRLNRLGNFFFNMAIAAVTGKRITDSQTGFRAVKKGVLMKLNLSSSGYDIESEITVKGLKNGFVFEEKPITCKRREYSASKLKIFSDGTRILKAIVKATVAKIEH